MFYDCKFFCIADPIGGRLYWTDNRNIKSSKLDGTDEKVMFSNSSISPIPWGIVSHGSNIYFSDRLLGKIFRLDKSPGSTPVTMHTEITEDTPKAHIFGLVLYSREGKLYTLVYRVPPFFFFKEDKYLHHNLHITYFKWILFIKYIL